MEENDHEFSIIDLSCFVFRFLPASTGTLRSRRKNCPMLSRTRGEAAAWPVAMLRLQLFRQPEAHAACLFKDCNWASGALRGQGLRPNGQWRGLPLRAHGVRERVNM